MWPRAAHQTKSLVIFNALLCLNFKADCIMICMMNIHTLQTVISRCLTNQSQYSGAPLTPPSCKMLHNLWHLYTLTNIFSCVLIKFTYSIFLTFQWLRYIQILQLRNNLFLVLRNIHCNPLWNGLRHGNPTLLLCWKCSCWWWCRCHCNVVLSTNCVSSSAVEVQTKNLRSLTCFRNFDAFFSS